MMFRSRRVYYSLIAFLCLAVLMAACGGQSPATPGPEQTDAPAEPAAPTAQPPATEFTSPVEEEASPLPTPPVGSEAETIEQPAKPIENLPPLNDPGSGIAPLTGAVPQDLLDAVFDDLGERLGASREAIVVERAGVVVWRDGSLGCPQPGMMYTQALVPGYRIILSAGGETFDYHASDGGYFLLCEEGLAEDPLPPDEGGEPQVESGLETLIAQARSDLAAKLSVDIDQIQVLEARAVVWPDASLGCPQPGMEYKQVPVDGALILLTVDGKVYEYHSGGGREPFLCEQPAESQGDTLPPIDLLSLTPGSPGE